MNPMLNIAIQAIRQIGNFIIKQYALFNINNTKIMQHKNNLLIQINEKSNELIKNIIKKYYPSHTASTVSHCTHDKRNNNVQWIVNPLDSQINFIKNLPYFASSIAIKIKGRTEIAVIYDPIHNDLFSAIRGQGTQFNGRRIHHSYNTKKILYEESIITYFPYCKNIINILNTIHHIQNHKNFRCSGAITLDLAYVAAGRIDALFAINLKEYNIDSGALLIQESGALILNLNKHNNKKNHIYTNILAGNPKFIKFILRQIPTLQQYY